MANAFITDYTFLERGVVQSMDEMKVIQKTIDMIKYAYLALAQFPKSEKYAMAADIKRCLDQLLELEVEAQKKYYKKSTLQNLDVTLAKVRVYTRIAHELGFLQTKKYEHWTAMNVEIGKMIGGWIKSQADKS